MGKIGNLAYNIGTSLNKEDINSHRQTITPTAQTLENLSNEERLATQQNNQALLDANEVQRLEGVESDGVWGYIAPGINGEACTGVECSDRQIMAQVEACKTDDTQCRDYPEYLKTLASFIVPTTKEEVALAVVTGGAGGYVIKVGGKVISKVFKSKDGAQKALDKAQELAKLDIEDKVKENISNSQTARQSSGYGQFSQTADNISALKELNVKQLDRKFKHAVDFGIVTTKKNTQTINQFGEAIKAHMRSPDTVQFGTYGFIPDSKVFYNKVSHNIVVITKDGSFSTGFRLKPGTPQYENFFKNGVLR